MKQSRKWSAIGLIMCVFSILTIPAYADFGHGPMHANGPINGNIEDVELVTFEATVDHVQLPLLIVSDEQTVQWSIYAGNLRYWEDQGYSVEVGDALTVTGASVMYGMEPGAGSGMHNGGGFAYQGISPHFVVFSIENNMTGQTMQFRDSDTGAPLWSHFGPNF